MSSRLVVSEKVEEAEEADGDEEDEEDGEEGRVIIQHICVRMR
jgi:hypothetical protein